MTTLETLQLAVYGEYELNGYVEMWNSGLPALVELKSDIAELGLIVTEISEAMEDIRSNNYIGLRKELADIIIRTLNFAKRKGITDLSEIIINKHNENLKRGKLHGRDV